MYLRFTHFWMWGYMYMWESYCVQYLHVYTNVSLSVLCIMCTHVCVCVRLCVRVRVHTCISFLCPHTHTYAHARTRRCVPIICPGSTCRCSPDTLASVSSGLSPRPSS